jgi:hypothetical protein
MAQKEDRKITPFINRHFRLLNIENPKAKEIAEKMPTPSIYLEENKPKENKPIGRAIPVVTKALAESEFLKACIFHYLVQFLVLLTAQPQTHILLL